MKDLKAMCLMASKSTYLPREEEEERKKERQKERGRKGRKKGRGRTNKTQLL
jgi:hypothetical protein